MKAKSFAAIGFAALLIVLSCNWFAHENKNTTKSESIGGKYELTNISDSMTNEKWINPPNWLFGVSSNDSLKIHVNFSKDSVLSFEINAKSDSTKYYVDTSAKTLYIKVDSVFHPFEIIKHSDSTLNLFETTDSLYYVLRKL